MQTIGQRELRNDNAEIVRRVEAGESFIVTRNGEPVADLVPHRPSTKRRAVPTAEIADMFARTPVDAEAWKRNIAEMDAWFGDDDDIADPWERETYKKAERERESRDDS
ncbi:type II toxin-antitoxin system Phd/YefM family antitoxin [Halopolyspora algeriensis]|nr:type II toxin-antitoxin system prevent-host-death family antitoxin [Halopolyspora algeriensis]